MTKRNWAKNKPTTTVTIDKETHFLLSILALEHKLCLKDMMSVVLLSYAESKKEVSV